ncbi:hypothetical protein JCM1840_003066 [Sporobolomyces johnsonii]
MVKVTSSLLVGATLLASSTTLAAPTRFKRSTDVGSPSGEVSVDGLDESEQDLGDSVGALVGTPTNEKRSKVLAEPLEKRVIKPTMSTTDKIRRNLPLTDSSSAEDLAKRASVVSTLGLNGALAPLGLGPLIPTVESTVDGLPLVGGPVGGLVHTVDNTVGLTDLLNKPAAPATPATPKKRQLLDGLTGQLGGATGSLSGLTGQLGGATSALGGATSALGGATSALNGATGGLASNLPLSSILGNSGTTSSSSSSGSSGLSNSQLQSLLGQLQGMGLGGLSLDQLQQQLQGATGSGSSSGSSSSSPTAQAQAQAASILQGLSVPQAEQLGLLPSGTTSSLLGELESAASSSGAGSVANAFQARVNGFKAQHHNGTMADGHYGHEGHNGTMPLMNSTMPFSGSPLPTASAAVALNAQMPKSDSSMSTSTMSSSAAANAKETAPPPGTPTFSIAGPAAVESALGATALPPGASAPPSKFKRDLSAAPASSSAVSQSASQSMTPAAQPSASSTASTTEEPSTADDSGSEYSGTDESADEEGYSDEESDNEADPSPARMGRRDNGDDGMEMNQGGQGEPTGDMEGQGPNASGAWHAASSTSMAETPSQTMATAEAMSLSYSDASTTAAPTTTGNAKRWAIHLD